VGAGLGDDRAAVRVADQHDRSVLDIDDLPGGLGVALQGQGGVLHDADPESVAAERVVDAPPAGAVDESSVYENDIPQCAHGDPSSAETGECQHGRQPGRKAAYVM
jgi:hypothetical protein